MPKDLEKAIEWLETTLAGVEYQVKYTTVTPELKDAFVNMNIIYDAILSYENKKVLDNVFEDRKDGEK